MKNNSLTCLVAAIAMACSSVAFAQNDMRRDGHDPRASHDDRNDRGRGDERRGHDQGHRGEASNGRPGPPPRYADRGGPGAGPDHNFYRGGRLPPQWRSRQYVVDDWRGHRLSAPPRGYHWVQTGGDYVLVAITTGIIASILLNQ